MYNSNTIMCMQCVVYTNFATQNHELAVYAAHLTLTINTAQNLSVLHMVRYCNQTVFPATTKKQSGYTRLFQPYTTQHTSCGKTVVYVLA